MFRRGTRSSLVMEIQHLPRPPLRRNRKPRSRCLSPLRSTEEEFLDTPDHFKDREPQRSRFIRYALVFLKVGLWLGFAWVLSSLHMGVPCFLLPVILLVYRILMKSR